MNHAVVLEVNVTAAGGNEGKGKVLKKDSKVRFAVLCSITA